MSHPLCDHRRMRKTKSIARGRGTVNPAPATIVNDFDQLTAAGETVEHVTVPGFLRRIPHPWHIDDITRFGDKVGRVAEAMQLSYLTTIQPQLGMIRVFPLPLLQRVYELMAPQFQWPGEPLALIEGNRVKMDELRKAERLTNQINELLSSTDEPKVVEAATVLLNSLETTATTLRQEIAG